MKINITLDGEPLELALFCRVMGWQNEPVIDPLPVPAPQPVPPVVPIPPVQPVPIPPVQPVPEPPAPVPPDVPPVTPPEEVKAVLPGFATYIVDLSANGPKRTERVKGYIDKLAGVFREVVLFCNAIEIDEGDLPNYLDAKDVGWWADTFRAVYDVQKKREMAGEGRRPGKPLRDFFGETMAKCETYPALLGYVLDDVHAITPAQFEEVVAAMRTHTKKTLVASFGALTDIGPYRETLHKHNVKVARQLYRQELADGKLQSDRTSIITRWLEQPGYVCHIGHLEYFKAGNTVTSGDDLRDMYYRCLDEEVNSFMGYAAVDANGFRVWEHADLWDVLKDCADHHRKYSKLP